ncbi:WzxE protein [Klebsiella pneumoniae IS39]|nr:WzxE protein [Klebsiella pneumoniae IS39]
MSLAKASLWTAASTLVKIGAGLLVVKLLAVSFGPAGVGQAGKLPATGHRTRRAGRGRDI